MSETRLTLKITRWRTNPEFDPKKDYRYSPAPLPTIEDEVLLVTITEAQFAALRKAVLEQF